MSDAEMHRRESGAIGEFGETLKKAGMQPKPGGWLEGVFIDTDLQNAATQIFSEWLFNLVNNPSGETVDEQLDRLKEMLKPHLTEFQRSRITHDFLAGMIEKAKGEEEGGEEDDLE
jgi:hypothetical protein